MAKGNDQNLHKPTVEDMLDLFVHHTVNSAMSKIGHDISRKAKELGLDPLQVKLMGNQALQRVVARTIAQTKQEIAERDAKEKEEAN